MALNPIAFTEKVVTSFLRYQLTTYPFADENLLGQMRHLLSLDQTRRSPLMKGPYISLSRPFSQGAGVEVLVQEGLLHPHMSRRIPSDIHHVYGHQEKAIRAQHPEPKDRFATCLPLIPLKVAAGKFSELQNIDAEEWEWVKIDTNRRLRPGMFVAQVVGKSMEPSIPDGSYCLFTTHVPGTRQGRTVVVELDDELDPETGERYTIKRYQSEKTASDDGTWRHIRVVLKPNNPEYEPIELTCEEEGNVRVVAELLEVLD